MTRTRRPVVHIVSNAEISLTECGRFLAGHADVNTREAFPMASGKDVACWDDTLDIDQIGRACLPCYNTYMAL